MFRCHPGQPAQLQQSVGRKHQPPHFIEILRSEEKRIQHRLRVDGLTILLSIRGIAPDRRRLRPADSLPVRGAVLHLVKKGARNLSQHRAQFQSPGCYFVTNLDVDLPNRDLRKLRRRNRYRPQQRTAGVIRRRHRSRQRAAQRARRSKVEREGITHSPAV